MDKKGYSYYGYLNSYYNEVICFSYSDLAGRHYLIRYVKGVYIYDFGVCSIDISLSDIIMFVRKKKLNSLLS